MKNIIKTYPDFKFKALTFSFDDGCFEDVEVTNYFRQLHLKATFNLNSNLMTGEHVFNTWNWLDVRRLDKKIIKQVYEGFEVASHTSNHTDFNNANLDIEIKEDIKNLSEIVGYKVEGFAYPFGIYNDKIIKYLKDNNILYARAIHANHTFDIPSNWYTYGGSVQMSEDCYLDMVNKYVLLKENKMSILYIWGHTYELNLMHNHDSFYNSLLTLANKDDIYYATNIEIVKYLNALDNLIINDNEIINKSNIDLYLIIDDVKKIIKANDKISF